MMAKIDHLIWTVLVKSPLHKAVVSSWAAPQWACPPPSLPYGHTSWQGGTWPIDCVDANSGRTGLALLCHDNVDVVLVKNLTKLLKECFVGGNVAHLVIRMIWWRWSDCDNGERTIFLPLAVPCLVVVYLVQPLLLQSLWRSGQHIFKYRISMCFKINRFLSSTSAHCLLHLLQLSWVIKYTDITFKQSKVCSQLTQAQSAVVTEGSVETTASLDEMNILSLMCPYRTRS